MNEENCPYFSVLIPAYNAESSIRETLDSILAQNFSDFEVIVANDGSKDNTESICEEYRKRDSRVIYFNKVNEGLMKTRFFLFSKARGKYCICCDSDDTWNLNLLERVHEEISQKNPDILVFSHNYWHSKQNEYIPKKYKGIEYPTVFRSQTEMLRVWEKLLTTSEINNIWTRAIRRSIIPIKWSIPLVSYGEDKLINIELLKNSNSVLIIPDTLHNYRDDNTSMIRSFKPQYFDEVLATQYYALNTILEMNLSEISRKELSRSVLMLYFQYLNNAIQNHLPTDECKRYASRYFRDQRMTRFLSFIDVNDLSAKERVLELLLRQEKFGTLICLIRCFQKIRKKPRLGEG